MKLRSIKLYQGARVAGVTVSHLNLPKADIESLDVIEGTGVLVRTTSEFPDILIPLPNIAYGEVLEESATKPAKK